MSMEGEAVPVAPDLTQPPASELISHSAGWAYWFVGAPICLLGLIAITNAVLLRPVNLWVLVTAPVVGPNSTNSVIGYSFLLDGSVLHKENLSPLFYSLAYNGYNWGPDGYSLRTVQPFLVSLGSPFVGLITSALVVNYVAYVVLVIATARLAYRLCYRVDAALVAGALAAVGIGPIMHLNDFSGHLLGFAFYALVVAVIFETDVWRAKRPFAVHFAIGCLLALASLEYSTGIELAIAYVLTSLPHSRWSSVAVAGAMGLFAPTALTLVLKELYSGLWGRQVSVGSYDQAYFWVSIANWEHQAQAGWLNVGHLLTSLLLDSTFVAFPLVTLAGLVAMVLITGDSARKRWFFAVFFTLPFLSMFVFSQSAGARGYIAYGSTLLLYVGLAVWLTKPTASRRAQLAGWVTFAVLFFGQLAWSLSYLRGYYFPAMAFYIGYSGAPDPYLATVIRSASDAFPAWRALGGSADFVHAGGLIIGSISNSDPSRHSYKFALFLKAFVLAPAFGVLLVLVRHRLSLVRSLTACLVLWLCTSLVLAYVGVSREHEVLAAANPDQVTEIRGPQDLRQSIELSPDVTVTIRKLYQANSDLELVVFARGHGIRNAQVTIGGIPVRTTEVPLPCCSTQIWSISLEDFVQASRQSSEFTFTATIENGFLGGWQVAPIKGRRSEPSTTVAGHSYTPSLELRVLEIRNGTSIALLVAY